MDENKNSFVYYVINKRVSPETIERKTCPSERYYHWLYHHKYTGDRMGGYSIPNKRWEIELFPSDIEKESV